MEHGWIERLRGVDEWPSVDAIVISVRQIKKGNRYGDGAWRSIRFHYRCGSRDFDGKLCVDGYTSIYELAPGDHFDIQCNPHRPNHYFCAEAKSVFFKWRSIIGATILMLILYGLANEVFRR